MKSTINKIQVFLSAMLLIGLMACEGDLEPQIFDKQTGSNFPATAKEAETAVNNVYYEFRGGSWARYNYANNSRIVQGLFCTDEFTCNWNGYWSSPFNFTWAPDEFPFSQMYYVMTPAVTIATSAIVGLRRIEDQIEPDLFKRYIAEIKAARGYFMYDLYNLYGPVPVITEEERVINEDYDYRPRPTSEQMVDLIASDLKEAAKDLPVSYSDSDFGRMTKGAAWMGLVKLYLHEKDWENVEKYARFIKDSCDYVLQDDYKSIWSIDNEKNKEIIFGIVCAPSPDGVENNARTHILAGDWLSPNGYPAEGWNGYKVPWQFYDRFDTTDLRLECLHRYYNNIFGQVDSKEAGHIGAMPLKYSEDPNGTGTNQGVDYVIYRYADVLLALAEALNEIHDPTQEAIDLINEIRWRAFKNEDKKIKLADFPDKEDLRAHILDERGYELYFEGNRREDLIRHGKFVEYANDTTRMGTVRPKNPDKKAQAKHVLYPIPNKVIVESGGIIKQNEGYN